MEFKIMPKFCLFCLFVLLISDGLKAETEKFNGSISFMTYNVHSCIGMDKALDPNRIAEVIRKSGAQVIGLQEVENNFGKRSNFENQPKILAAKLGMYVVYGPAMKGEKFGNALLSKYPIIESKNHKLFNMSDFEQRACIEAGIKTPAGIFKVFVTHIDHSNDEIMVGQLKDISGITDSNEKMVLLGDFNEQAPPYKQASLLNPLIAKYGYVFDIVAMKESTTVVEHNRRFDHIFVSSDIKQNVKSCTVLKNEMTYLASDHFPVMVVLEFPFQENMN
jgi:endonuclease/exonuclease/phosphatase family metal-dependent hydrolase